MLGVSWSRDVKRIVFVVSEKAKARSEFAGEGEVLGMKTMMVVSEENKSFVRIMLMLSKG